MRRLAAMMMVLALVFTLVACGGEDDESSFDESGSTAATGVADAASATQPGEVTESADAGQATAATHTTTTGGIEMPKQWNQEPAMQLESGKDYGAVLHTNKGDIKIDLFEGETPRTVNNFVFLANQDFYQNVPFHRVIKDFMVQTGDPTGTGAGGPGYRFADEPVTRDYRRGTVAMANAGPNTNGSQFFIVHKDAPLPKNYTIFGEVTEGLDVLDAIANVPVGPSAMGEMSSPGEPVTLESVEITTQ